MNQIRHAIWTKLAAAAWLAAELLSPGKAGAQPTQPLDAATTFAFEMTDFAPPRVEREVWRERIWAINSRGVTLYNARTRSLITTILLPGWTYAVDQQGCAPELMLDWTGNALVSSTGTPTLWRIDAQTLEVERIDIAPASGAGTSPGFTGLFFVNREVLLAVSAIDGALWRIDLQTKRATKLALAIPVTGACALGVTAAKNVNPFRIDELGETLLRLCASSRHGVHQIEVTDLAQATRIDVACTDD